MATANIPWQNLLAGPPPNSHIAQIYRDENFQTEAISLFIGSGLQQGEGVIVIATVPHKQSFAQQLYREGFDLNDAVRRGQLRLLDTDATLSKLIVNGMPDWQAFRENMGAVIEDMQQRYPATRVYGEMVDILWRQQNYDATIHLEQFWNELTKIYSFSLFCSYFIDNLAEESYDDPFECLCKTHTHIIPIRDYEKFEEAVNEAGRDILGQTLNNKLHILSATDRPSNMPFAQAAIWWLKKNMPLTAPKILARIRARYGLR
jgi:hypothetical protein